MRRSAIVIPAPLIVIPAKAGIHLIEGGRRLVCPIGITK